MLLSHRRIDEKQNFFAEQNITRFQNNKLLFVKHFEPFYTRHWHRKRALRHVYVLPF